MNADCMPGSTFETRPLYKLPTTPRWRSRSMKISATWSSSRIAIRVSWPFEETIISLVMPAAPAGPVDRAGHVRHGAAEPRERGAEHHEHGEQAAQHEGLDGR